MRPQTHDSDFHRGKLAVAKEKTWSLLLEFFLY